MLTPPILCDVDITLSCDLNHIIIYSIFRVHVPRSEGEKLHYSYIEGMYDLNHFFCGIYYIVRLYLLSAQCGSVVKGETNFCINIHSVFAQCYLL